MKITNLKKKGNVVTFTASGITPQFANALRRTIIADVPVMAIEGVTFYENSSILNDELLAHRLGLMPLKTDLKTYNLMSECSCKGKGCGKCTALLTLEAKGPKTVYSGNMKAKDPKIIPVYEKMPLVKLDRDQTIKLEAHAQLGRGRDHIKWQGALASYAEKKSNTYDFYVESFGQLPPKALLSAAINTFNDKISVLKSTLK